MKALIVDDETRARELLQVLLDEHCPEIKHISEAAGLPEAAEIIRNERPDLVFMDIEMPDHSGLQIFEFIPREEVDFQLIFTTAYHEYAIKAFRLSAVDYLLKPLRPVQVRDAVKKALDLSGETNIRQKVEALQENINSGIVKKLALPVSDGAMFVNLEHIMYFEADGMYTNIISAEENLPVISKPLKFFAELLEDHPSFFRIHRSYLVNLNRIKKYVRSDGSWLIMEDEKNIPISRDKKDEFQKIMQNWLVE